MKKTILLIASAILSLSAYSQDLVILHTNDTHSQIEPLSSGNYKGRGGVDRREKYISQVRAENKNVILLDAGDFSMGTLLGAGYATDAYEMRLMGAMGIQATTFGNHEWDFGPEGVCAMLSAAHASGARLTELVPSVL